MNRWLRNAFFAIGLVSIAVMLCLFDMPWAEVWQHVCGAGYWFVAIVLLWLPIYMINAVAWQLIINDGEEGNRIFYWRILRYTISGYALNNVTPVGLLGGEPYRIMELTPYIGATKATSSVVLYSMMHICSHFCFWTFSLFLFVGLYASYMTTAVVILLAVVAVFCLVGLFFFVQGYRKGLAVRAMAWLSHIPLVGTHIAAFASSHDESLRRVDDQIAALHRQRRSTFYCSLSLEFVARMLGCFEIFFILRILTPDVSYWDCVLMQAFMSLFANILFFMPMQMGTREGGFAMVTAGLRMNGAFGVLTGLMTRLREMVWDAIGLLLIKL